MTRRAGSPSAGRVGAMEHVVRDVPINYVERGEGFPVLLLHGAGVDHREVMGCLDPVFEAPTGHRRIYPDLPGIGRTPAPETIRGADDVLEVLLGFIDGVIGDRPLLVAGHSAGGYYAQAIAGQRPEQVVGLALLCPLLAGIHDVPQHEVVSGSGSIGDAEFRDTSRCRQPRPSTGTRGTSNRPPGWPTNPRSHGSASGGNSPGPRKGSVPAPDPARDRTSGLDCRLWPRVGDARALSSRHLRGPGPGRSCAPARAARAGPRPGHRMARPGPRASHPVQSPLTFTI